MLDLTRALATERRARRELTSKIDQLEALLIAAQEEKHDALDRAQRLEDEYLNAQQARARTHDELDESRRNSRALQRQLHEQKAEGMQEPILAELKMEQLDELESRHTMALADVRKAKIDLQKRQFDQLERERAELHEKTLCAVCMCETADATFVHGDSGHQACCYECAIAVKASSGKCPICAQVIEAVIRHFHA